MNKWFLPVQDSWLVKEVFDPHCLKGFGHIQEYHAVYRHFLSNVLLTFSVAGQLQLLSGTEPKLLLTQEPTLAYLPWGPSGQDLLEQLTSSVKKTDGAIGRVLHPRHQALLAPLHKIANSHYYLLLLCCSPSIFRHLSHPILHYFLICY